MSQSGKIVFYSTEDIDAGKFLHPLLDWSGATAISIASRSKEREHGWMDFLEMMNSAAPEVDDPMECLGCTLPTAAVVDLYEHWLEAEDP